MVHPCIILADSPGALVELCGISVLERLLRTLQRCGFKRATVFSNAPDVIGQHLARPSGPRAEILVTVCPGATRSVSAKEIVDVWPKGTEFLPVLRGDTVFDERLLRLLTRQKVSAALVDSDVPSRLKMLVSSALDTIRGKLCGAVLLTREWLLQQDGALEQAVCRSLEQNSIIALDVAAQPSYSTAMRRDLRPVWFVAPDLPDKKLAEHVLLNSAQKGALDLPAYIHAPIENFLISRLCRTSISPNQLTVICNVTAWIVTILFATGHLVGGIVLALAVGVLDGLDGKQARVKVETTESGKLEHWFDALFEISWWTALAYHFRNSGQLPGAFYYLALLLLAETIDLIAKGSVLLTYGKLIDELSPFDRLIRLIGGRRNIYIWILAIGIVMGNPARAFVVAAWWEVLTAAVHIPRAAWAVWIRRHSRSGIHVRHGKSLW
jgi:1L-myo-inositol 1-phosphate cytidylyltransferase / CDP-L-myo-inositol myo-inositolphosphotransferase